ncbi:uncharacterized protein L969DRAFT_92334 [Mixia osmundae IAM 14324]|uniref:PIN domain-like protein n=1 Tax=Mixia osmundae (strain CBS 9802 / IAM 14324 / JCM 22182 / KY 12970) TaxID=764103 RepID=G7DTA0_MIXOS|nr:uncharacterized protein L969DRAFT_92334 [Mixia osmundae IAM 14324]KEI42915.1 hypothetical protein L969DRAFT_92334 [Mixia osmundae IAM 14324]GAA93747.1 hypothetical protein E5Q_00393 [Mixia osmundae IAM 14324]
MGVHGLWPIIQPVARPIALETLGNKRMAVDSSIWLHQFQLAMRDKEGRALDNAHILGFLRRICKLLYYGIKPVFVFDGGAPVIKRIAVSERKRRKRGGADSLAKTAEKLLSAQLRKAAVEEATRRQPVSAAITDGTGDVINQDTVYLDDLEAGVPPRHFSAISGVQIGAASSPTNERSSESPAAPTKKKYVHRDPYALPTLDEPLHAKATLSDPRMATEDELRSFIDEMRPEDFDLGSPMFMNLPTEVKYEIIGDLRIRSRQSNHSRVLAMKKAPTALDFSKAQIMHLKTRNELTQKLLTVTDVIANANITVPIRIASERNKEYVLAKQSADDGGGWVLGVRDGLTKDKPIRIDNTDTDETNATTTDEEFDEIDIPGTARLPSPSSEERKRMALDAIRARFGPVAREEYDPHLDAQPVPPQAPLFATSRRNADRLTGRQIGSTQGTNVSEPGRARAAESALPVVPSDSDSDESMDEVAVHSMARSSTRREPPPAVSVSPALDATVRQEVPLEESAADQDAILAKDYAQPESQQAVAQAPNGLASEKARAIEGSHHDIDKPIIMRDKRPASGSPGPSVAILDTSGGQVVAPLQPNPPIQTTSKEAADESVRHDSLLPLTADANRASSPPAQTSRLSAPQASLDSPRTSSDFIESATATRSELQKPAQHSAAERDVNCTRSAANDESFHDVRERSSSPAGSEASDFIAWQRTPTPPSRVRRTSTPPSRTRRVTVPMESPEEQLADFPMLDAGHELSDEAPDDDEEAEQGLQEETNEFTRFLAQLKNRNLDEMRQEVEAEIKVLGQQQKTDRRNADEITQQMAKEIRVMLRLFGIPYVDAPMEAEAQCAQLWMAGLVDGIITDDSDVFLFGGGRVFKNMFNQNKYVECFLLSDIERELSLDRDKLCKLAYFLGSDYVEGLPKVGPVLGMELMREFPGPAGLVEFRRWWIKVQKGQDGEADLRTAFRRRFKKSMKTLVLDESWPNPAVMDAYLNPDVETSSERFTWGLPDLDGLRHFLMDSLGWAAPKVEDLLLPLIKRMSDRNRGIANMQGSLERYFDVTGGMGQNARLQKKGYGSARLQAVVESWRKAQHSTAATSSDDEEQVERPLMKKRTSSSSTTRKRASSSPSASRKPVPPALASMKPKRARHSDKRPAVSSDEAGEGYTPRPTESRKRKSEASSAGGSATSRARPRARRIATTNTIPKITEPEADL